MIDVLDALTEYLRHDCAVHELTSDRVYPAELPACEAAAMPRPCVVLQLAGGIGEANNVPLQTPRVDVMCYGPTPKEARALYYEVTRALRALARKTHASTLLHSAIQGAGPLQGRTPETWPFCWSTFVVRASTVALE